MKQNFRKALLLAFIIVYSLSFISGLFSPNSFMPQAQAYSDETEDLDFSTVDSTWGNYIQMGGYSIYCTNDEILFYEDDLTLKTFSFPSILGDEWHISNIAQYNETHIIAGVSSQHTSVSNNKAWFQCWIINVASLGYSYAWILLQSVTYAYSTTENIYSDFCFVECDEDWFALVGGTFRYQDTPRFYVLDIEETLVKHEISVSDEYFFGLTWGFSSEEDADQAYVFSRSSPTSEQYRIFLFDADTLTLSVVGTGTNGYCSDFNMVFGYLTHSIYGNLYYDFLMAYPDLNDIETLYLELLRFNSTYLDETRVTLEVDSSVDEVRPFSILSPEGVDGEDDLTDGYYSVVYVGTSYELMQIVVALEDITTISPSLDIVSGQFAYQEAEFYYEEDNVGGWQHTTSVVGTFFDYDNGYAIADNFEADETPEPPTSYTATVASVPEIFVDFLVDEDTYQTPDEVEDLIGTYIFTAERAKINNSIGYLFDHWLVNGEDSYYTESIEATIYDDITLDIYYEETELYWCNVTSAPSINASFYIDDDYYVSPDDILVVPDNYTFTAQNSKIVESTGYLFDHWLINETDSYETREIELNITADTLFEINYTEVDVHYLNVSSDPEIEASFWVDDEVYSTPDDEVPVTESTHEITAQYAKTYQMQGYLFDHWLINGSISNTSLTIELDVSANTTLAIYYEEVERLYNFYGAYNETTGTLIDENVTITAFFDTEDNENYQFILTDGYVSYAPTVAVRYFHFELGENDREYWLDPNEDSADIYVFDDNLTGYTINFLDFAGALQKYPYVEAQFYVNGTLYTVDKRKVDTTNTIAMSLVTTRKYQIQIGSGLTSYTWGDLLMTTQTTVQLVVKAIDFPKESLLISNYLRIYALRESGSTSDTVTIFYQDTKMQTESVEINILLDNGESLFDTTQESQSFEVQWNSGEHNVSYTVTAVITHDAYGVMSWKQYLPRGMSDPPFSLAFLGVSFPFESAYLLPMLLIFFVAGCFSVINAEVGAILTVITAIILAYLGWIPISTGALITAFALALLMALAYAKRRVITA
jgi:hypothetical protein